MPISAFEGAMVSCEGLLLVITEANGVVIVSSGLGGRLAFCKVWDSLEAVVFLTIY